MRLVPLVRRNVSHLDLVSLKHLLPNEVPAEAHATIRSPGEVELVPIELDGDGARSEEHTSELQSH